MIKDLAQSYLITAPAYSVAETAAIDFVREILCEQGTGCGLCVQCRKYDSKNHIDVLTIEPAGDIIKVEDTEELADFLKMRPVEAARRVVIIKRADTMNMTVQNKLLKSLEDPPENTLFVLITDKPSKLLDTVKSRCIKKAVRPAAEKAVYDNEKEAVASVLSGGFAQSAADILADDAYFEMRGKILSLCENMAEGDFDPIESAVVLAGYDKKIADVLEIMARFFADAEYYKCMGKERYTPDAVKAVKRCSKNFTSGKLCRIVNILTDNIGRRSICPTLNAKLMCEAMLIDIQEVMNG